MWRRAAARPRSSCRSPASKGPQAVNALPGWFAWRRRCPAKSSTADVCCPSAACTACCAITPRQRGGLQTGRDIATGHGAPRARGSLDRCRCPAAPGGRGRLDAIKRADRSGGRNRSAALCMARYQVGHAHVRSLCCRPDRARPFSGIRSSDLSARGACYKIMKHHFCAHRWL